MFSRVLVANRGEVAVRVIRALHELGVEAVAVYSTADSGALHTRLADRAVCVGPPSAAESYLNVPSIIAAGETTACEAVHPGWGFLAENPDFVRACEDNELVFVGPDADVMGRMGDKVEAKRELADAGVPLVPGTEAVELGEARSAAAELGYPVLLKPTAGGGGKGMRLVEREDELDDAFDRASAEAFAAFADGGLYLEKLIAPARHVEVQVLCDADGGVLTLGERECSIQRRHQKVVEETPSLAVSPALRRTMLSDAAAVAKGVGYTNAGTIEFLVDEDGRHYFLEMNTRLQVEHPITEMVTRIDLVHWQIRIARGDRLTLDPDRLVVPDGHAIECRIYAEDPDNNFLPSPGRIVELRAPGGPGVRDDSGATAGLEVPIFYDPMISKLVAWAEDRPRAIARMRRGLREYLVAGIKTTIPFFTWLLEQPEFIEGRFHTTYLDDVLAARNGRPFIEPPAEAEDVATLAAVMQAVLSSGAGPESGERAAATGDRWKAQARTEGLR